jgi:hypothetical protein
LTMNAVSVASIIAVRPFSSFSAALRLPGIRTDRRNTSVVPRARRADISCRDEIEWILQYNAWKEGHIQVF